MIIFLDFDGVLHPVPNNCSTDFSALPLFEAWLRLHKDVRVVISSSWREIMSLDVLKATFSADLHDRVIDKCPIIESIGTEELWRHKEIMEWIGVNEYKGPWLALDDMDTAFPYGLPQLVACQTKIGIDQDVLTELTNKVLNYGHFS